MTPEKMSDYLPTLRKIEALEAERDAARAEVAKLKDQAVHWNMVWATSESDRKEALARLAELVEQKPVAIFDVAVNERTGTIHYSMENKLRSGDSLYAAAGASPQPSQALHYTTAEFSNLKNQANGYTVNQVTGAVPAVSSTTFHTMAQPSQAVKQGECWPESVMLEWDYWRAQIADGNKGSEPRDWFESLSEMKLVDAQPPHTPKVGDLRTDVVNPMAAWPWQTQESIEALSFALLPNWERISHE